MWARVNPFVALALHTSHVVSYAVSYSPMQSIPSLLASRLSDSWSIGSHLQFVLSKQPIGVSLLVCTLEFIRSIMGVHEVRTYINIIMSISPLSSSYPASKNMMPKYWLKHSITYLVAF